MQMDREDVSRHVLLWGEDNQGALEQLSVGIVGTTRSAQLLAVSLLSLGVGKLLLIDNTRAACPGPDYLLPSLGKGSSRVKAFSDMLSGLFPSSEVVGYHSPPVEAVLYRGI